MVVASSGLYIGGEETAVIASIERFPFPRRKPPFPAQQGVHGAPTVINNTETLAHVPGILRHGAPWYRGLGIGQASGTKLYSLSGDVLRPGLYELPMGTRLETRLRAWRRDAPGQGIQGRVHRRAFEHAAEQAISTWHSTSTRCASAARAWAPAR